MFSKEALQGKWELTFGKPSLRFLEIPTPPLVIPAKSSKKRFASFPRLVGVLLLSSAGRGDTAVKQTTALNQDSTNLGRTFYVLRTDFIR